MTRPNAERVISRLERWTGRIVAVCAIGTCLCFGGLAYLQVQVAGKASKGDLARDRQTAVYPVSVKLYTWAAAHPDSLITPRDLACFRDTSKCPNATPTP